VPCLVPSLTKVRSLALREEDETTEVNDELPPRDEYGCVGFRREIERETV
jgi:hypothetical protein